METRNAYEISFPKISSKYEYIINGVSYSKQYVVEKALKHFLKLLV
jgi:hypothetical protein